MKYFSYSVIGAVVLIAIASFFVIGSPRSERLRKFDELRVSHLQDVQAQLIMFWQTTGALPERLSALEDDIQGYRVSRDPETGGLYEYHKDGPLSFRLCAEFDTAMKNNGDGHPFVSGFRGPKAFPYPYGEGENWAHPQGRNCFLRTINPKLYQPRKPE